MDKIINTSLITDYSGEMPILTYSNPVTTVIRQNTPTIITRVYCCESCNCGCCGCCDSCCTGCCNCNFD